MRADIDRATAGPSRRQSAAGTEGKGAILPLSGGFGAECIGFDLRRPLEPADRRRVADAFLEHHLLVVRDQALSKEQLRDFAGMFGEVEGNIFRKPDGSVLEDVHQISNLNAGGVPTEDSYLKSNYHWHTDKSYLAVPALLTMLQALELPPEGGDTQFADMTRAYEALPEATKREIAGLRAVHSFEYMRASTGDRPLTEAERAATPPVVHPLVRTHPETGRKSLYVGMYCAAIVGMGEAEGRALIDRLQAHATDPRFVYVHRWQQRDLVLWDNRCLLHRAMANYDARKHRRVLQRAVVRGTAPV
jgi:alpha-ketoglutarate-dependent taurine dioxygenase